MSERLILEEIGRLLVVEGVKFSLGDRPYDKTRSSLLTSPRTGDVEIESNGVFIVEVNFDTQQIEVDSSVGITGRFDLSDPSCFEKTVSCLKEIDQHVGPDFLSE